jgi:hypothetical protein
MGTLPTDKFCGTGRDFKAEREKQDQAIEDSQREVASRQLSPDSLGRRVPRTLNETMQQQRSQRALNNMQWQRHLAHCRECAKAEARAKADA